MPKQRTTRRKSRKSYQLWSAKLNIPSALIVIVAIVAIGIGLRVFTHASAVCLKIVLPAYWYPNSAWTTAVNTHPGPSILILDISGSGAGNAPDSTFQTYVTQAQNAGVKVIGYDDTSYGSRSTGAVETEVQHYKAWYHVTDIFLDQVSSNTSQLSYYQTLYSYIHSFDPGSMVMLNPGDYPPQSYMAVGDVLMVYENTYANYTNATVPSWVTQYPATRFAHTIYATSSSHLANAISLAKSRNAGYIYVTDGSGSNPYSSLPSYWTTENQTIAAGCVVATPTPTPVKTPVQTPVPTHAPAHTPTPAPITLSTPTPTTVVSTQSPSPSPSPDPASFTPWVPPPTSGTSGPPTASGTIDLGSPTSTISVGDNVLSTNGKLDTTYLTNGTHIITIKTGKNTTTRTILVKNNLNPWQTTRNTLVEAFGGNKALASSTIGAILVLLAIAISFVLFKFIHRGANNARATL